jgi:rhamnosyltransferase subunit B
MRIVITTFGSFGDVYPYIGLGLGLQARGHESVLAMPGYYRTTVAHAGLGFHPVRPDLDPSDRRTVARIMDPTRGTEFIVRDLLLASLRDTYADLTDAVRGAELLISHPITFAAPVVAQRQQLPWIWTVLAPMSFFSVHDLPVFPPMPWAKRLERVPGAARAAFAPAGARVALARPGVAAARLAAPRQDHGCHPVRSTLRGPVAVAGARCVPR